jgi:hypothetical protein
LLILGLKWNLFGRWSGSAYLAAIAVLTLPAASAAELKKETIDAFDRHIAKVEARLAPRFRGEQFLWSDQASQRHQRLLQGAIVVEPAQDKGTIPVKGGLIHDFTGAAFIPGGTLADALRVTQDYKRHKEIYPDVADAQIRSRKGNDFQVFMRIVKAKLFLKDVLNTEQDIHFASLDASRAYSKSSSSRIAELADAGTPKEHELPVGNDRGLLWRLNVYWFFEERDHGVYIECEAITLTRDVPFGAGTLFSPIVQSVPAESVRGTLEQTRKAIAALVKP